jgi:glucokinase
MPDGLARPGDLALADVPTSCDPTSVASSGNGVVGDVWHALGILHARANRAGYGAHMVGEPMTCGPVVAVDIGGTKIASAIVTDEGEVYSLQVQPTVGEDAAELFDNLSNMIEQTITTGFADPVAIGVGCGGPMAAGGITVSPLNIPQWRAFPLRYRLSERFELPTFVDNDAKALALGEGWWGAARDERDYLAMVVSTGVGAGLVVDGQLLDGASGNAGHLGHVIVVPDGRPCACGGRGCLEAEASGTAIAATTGRPAAEATDDVKRRVGTLVGRAVAAAAVLCDLRLACVGGSVALGFGQPFFEAANEELERLAMIEYVRGVRIVPVGLGADAPLVGAAMVARRHLTR